MQMLNEAQEARADLLNNKLVLERDLQIKTISLRSDLGTVYLLFLTFQLFRLSGGSNNQGFQRTKRFAKKCKKCKTFCSHFANFLRKSVKEIMRKRCKISRKHFCISGSAENHKLLSGRSRTLNQIQLAMSQPITRKNLLKGAYF